MGEQVRRFTNSELSTWRQCRRRWYLTHYRKLGPICEETVSAASLGTLVHFGLETYYSGHNPAATLADVRDYIAADLEDADFVSEPTKYKKIQKQGDLAVTMLEGYFEWLEETGADSDLEFIAAERHIEVELKPGVSLLGKLDAKIRRRSTGEEFFLDHKTTMSIEQTEEQAYRSSQFRTYALLEYLEALAAGELPSTSGVLVNMLRKVGRTAASKPPFYGRFEFSFNSIMLRNHWVQVMAEIERIEWATEALDEGLSHHTVVPPSPSRDCSWMCPFKAICPGFDDGSDVESVIEMFYVQRDPLERYTTQVDYEA